MKQTFTTEDVAAAERYSFWQDAVSRSFFCVDTIPVNDRPFFGRFEKLDFGGIGLAHLQSSAQMYERTAAQCRTSGEELVYVDYQISGTSSLEQYGRTATLGPGELMLYDTARPMRNRLDNKDAPTSVLMMCVPRTLLTRRMPEIAAYCARTIAMTGDQAAYLLSVWQSSLKLGADVTGRQASMAADLILDCLASVVNSSMGAVVRRVEDAVHAEDILRVIKAQITDPALSVARVARCLSISPRTVHRRLSDVETTPEQAIMAARVERLRQELGTAANAARSITTLAFECGFSDSATASRQFRRLVGQSPGEYRAAN